MDGPLQVYAQIAIAPEIAETPRARPVRRALLRNVSVRRVAFRGTSMMHLSAIPTPRGPKPFIFKSRPGNR